ncbi:RPC9-like protein [Mya arenaria]|uniref:DNA-directed RNA polymerase III subunit RPC9 n=1 Tax=Mya arenaria TaxID=6604 RepID=A0ABY7FP25_MYAAR|nr:DNA-directed RNA polymerase III subunit RPC9-like [Mya arenaria]WAR23069.1 RPC9-like protein [Mya arenaria]
MEVKKEKSAMLSNYEVLALLQDIQKGHNKQKKMHTNIATVSYEIIQHLENTACAKQSPEVISNFMKALEPYKLTKAEKLQFLNLRPRTAVEIQLIVEESEERLTEDQIYELLDLLGQHLPGDDTEQEQEEMEEEEIVDQE